MEVMCLLPEGDRLFYAGKCCKLLDSQVHRRWIGRILSTRFVRLKLQTTLHVMSVLLSTKCIMPVFIHVSHSSELKLISADSWRTCFNFIQARHCLFKSTVSTLTQEQEDSSGLVALDTLRSFKRPDPPCDIGSHQSKRRKSSSLHSIRENALTSNVPSLQRSYSETEATIKKALLRCEYLSVWLYRPVWHRTVIICVIVQANVAQDLHYLIFLNVRCRRHLVGPFGWQIAATAHTEEIHESSCMSMMRVFRNSLDCALWSLSFTLYMFFLSESCGLLLYLMPLCAVLYYSQKM
jgi:hypothetical protein